MGEPLDYMREPIPAVSLVRRDGSRLDLRHSTKNKALLLLALRPDAEGSGPIVDRLQAWMDAPSTGVQSAAQAVHVHCWHTDEPFSKHRFAAGGYAPQDAETLPSDSVARRCLELSFASLGDPDRR